MELRGGSFTEMFNIFKAMAEALPSVTPPARPRRLPSCTAAAWRRA
jgi:6-phosphofructokinase 1